MTGLLAAEIAGLVVLLLCSALLTGAEAAYFSLGRARLKRLAERHEEQPRTAATAPLLASPTSCW